MLSASNGSLELACPRRADLTPMMLWNYAYGSAECILDSRWCAHSSRKRTANIFQRAGDRSHRQNDLRCLAASRSYLEHLASPEHVQSPMSKALFCSEKGPSPTSYSSTATPRGHYGVLPSEKHRFLGTSPGALHLIVAQWTECASAGLDLSDASSISRRKTPH